MKRFEDLMYGHNELYFSDNFKFEDGFTFRNIKFENIVLDNNSIGSVDRQIFQFTNTINGTGLYDTHNFNFIDCIFDGELKLNDVINRTIKFENCSFTDIVLKNIKRNNEEVKNGFTLKNIKSIKNLTVDSCEFHGKFYINEQDDENNNEVKIGKLIIKDTEFKNNFKLHNCKVNDVEIKDIDFEKNADFYKSTFTKGIDTDEIYFKSINFKSLALFGDTEFFEKLIFKYVTFEGHNHFKSAKLHKGLDLEYTNVQKEINFYGMEILDKNLTSQETYRIIKNQFEKLNNKIEANKYHALELDQRRRELEKDKWKNFSEYLVFKIHDLSSKHSTSYFRAVLGIIFVGLFTISWVHIDIVKDLFFNPSNFKTEYLSKIWDEFWQYINITNLEKLKDKPDVFFINKVLLGYLYYQFLTAIRKDTRK